MKRIKFRNVYSAKRKVIHLYPVGSTRNFLVYARKKFSLVIVTSPLSPTLLTPSLFLSSYPSPIHTVTSPLPCFSLPYTFCTSLSLSLSRKLKSFCYLSSTVQAVRYMRSYMHIMSSKGWYSASVCPLPRRCLKVHALPPMQFLPGISNGAFLRKLET